VRLFFDHDAQPPDTPPMYSLHVYFGRPVTTSTNAGSSDEDIDEDEIRYFLLRDSLAMERWWGSSRECHAPWSDLRTAGSYPCGRTTTRTLMRTFSMIATEQCEW
jgi:hypothetical protein